MKITTVLRYLVILFQWRTYTSKMRGQQQEESRRGLVKLSVEMVNQQRSSLSVDLVYLLNINRHTRYKVTCEMCLCCYACSKSHTTQDFYPDAKITALCPLPQLLFCLVHYACESQPCVELVIYVMQITRLLSCRRREGIMFRV